MSEPPSAKRSDTLLLVLGDRLDGLAQAHRARRERVQERLLELGAVQEHERRSVALLDGLAHVRRQRIAVPAVEAGPAAGDRAAADAGDAQGLEGEHGVGPQAEAGADGGQLGGTVMDDDGHALALQGDGSRPARRCRLRRRGWSRLISTWLGTSFWFGKAEARRA